MKGIFCLEGFWYGDHRDATSVSPVLDLIHRCYGMPFLHHRCATMEEFRYSISRWKTKGFHKKYPILYLAFHGEEGCILIGKANVSLNELASLLEDKCEGVVIYFGSCATMKVDFRRLQAFMEKTRTLALLGYRQEIPWLQSASFEILLIDYLLSQPFDTRGVEKIQKDLLEDCKGHIRKLDFRMVINKSINFPRRRSKPSIRS